MKLYQNDFYELPDMVNSGCLFMDLVSIVVDEFKVDVKRKDVVSIYELCNARDIIGMPNNKKAKGAFVWDHEGVLNVASIVFGHKEAQWEYSARIYTKQMEDLGYTTIIFNPDYANKCKYLIFQVKTTEVPGHFKRFNYDPWQYGSTEILLKSVRYYRLKNKL